MKKTLISPLLLLVVWAVLPACESDKHAMVAPEAGTVIACRECYDEVYKMQQWSASRGGAPYQQTHTRHECPSCKTEMSIYSENGVTKVKCAKCAPEGLACDKCLPPKRWTPPADTSTSK